MRQAGWGSPDRGEWVPRLSTKLLCLPPGGQIFRDDGGKKPSLSGKTIDLGGESVKEMGYPGEAGPSV